MNDLTGESEFPGDFRNGAIDYEWDSFDYETKLFKGVIELRAQPGPCRPESLPLWFTNNWACPSFASNFAVWEYTTLSTVHDLYYVLTK
jgi:hypothetical protein